MDCAAWLGCRHCIGAAVAADGWFRVKMAVLMKNLRARAFLKKKKLGGKPACTQ